MRKFRIIAEVFNKRGVKLAEGENSYTKTHPLQSMYARRVGRDKKIYLHAEIQAIIRGLKTKQDIYRIKVTRKGKGGELLLAKPCPVCMEAIREAGIKVIEFSINGCYQKKCI